jgi:hypothetical protein
VFVRVCACACVCVILSSSEGLRSHKSTKSSGERERHSHRQPLTDVTNTTTQQPRCDVVGVGGHSKHGKGRERYFGAQDFDEVQHKWGACAGEVREAEKEEGVEVEEEELAACAGGDEHKMLSHMSRKVTVRASQKGGAPAFGSYCLTPPPPRASSADCGSSSPTADGLLGGYSASERPSPRLRFFRRCAEFRVDLDCCG